MAFSHPLVVVLVAIGVWWLSTGLVLAMVNRTERGGWRARQVLPVMTLAGGLGVVLMVFGGAERTPLGSYAGFFGALLVWAWHEAAFLTGALTGRRRGECPPGLKGLKRFKAAFEAVCDHEIAILVTALVLYLLLYDADNRFGLATFGLLWGMRISAKLLIFLGAPHAVSELMPRPIAHLKTYFKTDRIAPIFPLLMVAATGLFAVLVIGAMSASDAHSLVGHILLASFMALAILEHLILVLPVSDTALWRWAMPRKAKPVPTVLVVSGREPAAEARTERIL
ncbi:putative photosynthetic complex assembly protein 2 [Rhizobium sp. RU20A]|uniref:putative photosynthetic complex assembly protein PuhE n=1 Tax=Rhizobium sp. RU20A TaxID=1907412 RepID=UPI000956D765|nr:putative photosynthetic complex assembly protein PuhE [Rhizobium sp. RU20A]SIR42244.1 putative photosynthetic complex assembly protein 2 [Rhizobium sp. RU20A]